MYNVQCKGTMYNVRIFPGSAEITNRGVRARLRDSLQTRKKRNPQKSQKTLRLIGKTHMEKTNAQNLIKPVENEDFLSQNRKMASKMIKKALRL